jgi:hypothetical protein
LGREKNMKTKHIIGLLLISVSMFGCKTIEPIQTGTNGEYIHSETQVAYPPNLGVFQRGDYHVYDSKGKDISVGYNLYSQKDQIAMTIYSFPAPSLISIGSPKEVILEAKTTLFRQYAEAEVQQLSQKHTSGKLVERKEIPNEIGTPEIKGVFALFSYTEPFAGKSQEVLSELHLFQKDKWLIKYRITYPKGSKDNARKLIDQLMTEHKNSQPRK